MLRFDRLVAMALLFEHYEVGRMSDEWNAIGFVISSNYRVTVLRRLNDGPATPSQIANDEDIAITHVSRALRELGERDLVELLVPENRRKGRVYGITEKGERIWEEMQSQNLAE
jgi:DNA-binding MarR family transcriptional regulator